jgi:phospholipase/lecithinase/hemolysin
MIPLEDTPIYSAKSYPNRYWTAPRNTTEWNVFMAELTASGNALSRLMLQDLAPQLPGAHVGLFDSYTLFNDIMDSPAAYLNGTVQPNISGMINSCVFKVNESTSNPGVCTTVRGAATDSYLW